MRSYGSANKQTVHDPKVTIIHPKDNFPVNPVEGELVYAVGIPNPALFLRRGEKWEKIQTLTNTVIEYGAEFPDHPKLATFFYNNSAQDDELPKEAQLYGLYFCDDSGAYVKLLTDSHIKEYDPHPQYMQATEVISRFQPLKTSTMLGSDMLAKLVPGEFWKFEGFSRTVPITEGFYKYEMVLFHDMYIDAALDFGVPLTGPQTVERISGKTTVSGYIDIPRDTTLGPIVKLVRDVRNATNPSSVKLLKNSFIAFELV